jgi:hypothetical protein
MIFITLSTWLISEEQSRDSEVNVRIREFTFGGLLSMLCTCSEYPPWFSYLLYPGLPWEPPLPPRPVPLVFGVNCSCTVCNKETVCNNFFHTVQRMVTLCNKDFLLHSVAIRGTLCNNTVQRMATICNNCYILFQDCTFSLWL